MKFLLYFSDKLLLRIKEESVKIKGVEERIHCLINLKLDLQYD